MIFGSDRKNGGKRSCQKRIRGGEEVEVCTFLLCNDKNYAIADKILSYFW